MVTPRREVYSVPSGATGYVGRPVSLSSLVPAGTIMSISKNTLADIDPAKDPLANPSYPGPAPWEGAGWLHVRDYSGAAYASALGASGTYLQAGFSGHSASQATMWAGFDIATQKWVRVGKRPLPTNWTGNYAYGSNPPSSRFDHDWLEWNGGSTDWPAGFAQPGYNPPAGSHTRACLTYRPPSKAGNSSGQIIMGTGTGGPQATTTRGTHYYDLDTGLFSRMAALRANGGDNSSSRVYDPVTDTTFGWGYDSSASATALEVVPMATRVPTMISGLTGGPYLEVDGSQIFICGRLLVVAEQKASYNGTQYLYAIPIAGLLDGTVKAWTKLSQAGTNFPPPKGSIASAAVQWQLCPANGSYYAPGCTGGNKLYKLTPPGATDSVNLAGTWTFGFETLAGEAMAASAFAYNRLQWVPALSSFIFTGDDIAGPVQAIRPIGI